MTENSIERDLSYWMNDEEKIKMNIPNIPIRKGVETSAKENNENSIDPDGIVEVRYENEIYRTWKVKFIKPFIFKFLKEKCPHSLIVREINKIDIVIFSHDINNQIPVEIQKTPINSGKTFGHSLFEQSIRKQIEDNIENYGLCWFFFDAEYHRLLQYGNVGKSTSIDLTWLVKLMKEDTLKVFSIKYDGYVKELTTKDFDFLKNVSQTCKIGYYNDERILNRNKLKICSAEFFGHKFSQKESDDFYTEVESFYAGADHQIDEDRHYYKFFIKYGNNRCKLYGYILRYTESLNLVNEMLDMNINDIKLIGNAKHASTYLGIFRVSGTFGHGNLVEFVDKFDICQYFPGYLRNKEQWESYRGTNLNPDTFTRIINGSLKFTKTMKDY